MVGCTAFNGSVWLQNLIRSGGSVTNGCICLINIYYFHLDDSRSGVR